MKQEVKDIIGVLIIIIPACVFIFVWWLNCPLYAETKAQQQLGIQTYLIGHYYNPEVPYKQVMIDRYGFTDNDVNPRKILERYMRE